jgi:hypothetical protein
MQGLAALRASYIAHLTCCVLRGILHTKTDVDPLREKVRVVTPRYNLLRLLASSIDGVRFHVQGIRQLVNSWATSATGVVGRIRNKGVIDVSESLANCAACRENDGDTSSQSGHRLLVIDAFWIHSYSR